MAELDLPKAKKRLDALVAAFAVRTFYQRLAFSYRLNVVSCCAGAHAIEKRCIALSLSLVPSRSFLYCLDGRLPATATTFTGSPMFTIGRSCVSSVQQCWGTL